MKKILLASIFLVLITSSVGVFAQDRTVSGKVTSVDDGSPLPGVNVVLKGTTIGAVTDVNGTYNLSVSNAGGTLVFTFIGLKSQEVEIGNRAVIDVSLASDVSQLQEVVITGYGLEQKRDLTGSIASLKGDVIENLPVQSFDRAIQGRLAGVQVQSASGAPGGAINIRVRGPGSLSNNTPLYIIDGVQVQAGGVTFGGSNNALAAINPNDIESIEVLKDAAASAIYGAQSANGVVVITTKRGKKGKSSIDVTYQRGAVQPLNLYDVMDAPQFAQLKEAAYLNSGLDPASATGAYAQFGKPGDASTFTNYDWVDALFRTGQLESVNVSASGGDDKTSFYVSGSYEKQEGQIIKSDWSRASFRTNFEHRATDKFTIKLNIGLTRQNNFGAIADGNFVNGPFQSAFVSQPNSPAKAEDGTYNLYPAHIGTTGAGHNFNYNILQGVNEERREGTTVQQIGNMNLSYKIFDWLTAIASGGLDFADTEYINERPSTIALFSSYGGQVSVINQRTTNYNVFGTLNFAKKFNDVHNVSAILGYEYKDNSQDQQTAIGRGFAYPELRTLNNAATNFDVAGFKTGYKRAGGFIKANYDYKSRYYANFTFRRDGNSRFGLGNQYGNFWAVGAAWRLQEENFLSGVGFLSDLKLRGSYGILGNAEGLGNFQARTNYGSGGQYLGGSGTRQNLGNDLLSWEEATQSQVGLDFAFFANRLYGSLDVYREDTKNQLLNTPLPGDSGYGSVIGNTGNVRNEGIELEIGAVVIDRGGFKYRTDFNVTFNRNRVTDLGGEDQIGTTLFLNQPIGTIWGIPYAGVNPANGKAMWYDINGLPTYSGLTADGRIIGRTLPKNYGGWTNSFSFKGISLEVFFQYQLGNDAFLGDLYNLSQSGAYNDNQLVSQLDYWKNPGDITNVPKPYEGGSVDGYSQGYTGNYGTGRFVVDAGYVRLKQVTLSYDLPAAVLSKIKFRRVNIFAQAMNLLTFSKFPGIDPEATGANSDQGTSTYGNYPNGKQFTAGVTLGF
jgi:TonB-dependent starch-binding outer membrane protein SusC